MGRSTHYERKRRLRDEGAKGLVPRSSRPKSYSGRQWTKAVEVRREKTVSASASAFAASRFDSFAHTAHVQCQRATVAQTEQRQQGADGWDAERRK